jgi:putative PIN family toxin of toxin-antitoxin system
VRAVLDANVVISALLSPAGAPAQILVAWQEGAFEAVVCEQLLEEIARAAAYPKLRRRIALEDVEEVIEWLRRSAIVAPDPELPPPIRSPDPGDDYLIALAAEQRAVIVSGDAHLLELGDRIPVSPAARFLEDLRSRRDDA